MEVEYGDTPIQIPAATQQTDITTYLWPGFLGEFDHTTCVFDVWELVGPTRWIHRPDIVAPPFTCLGQDTCPGWQWTSSEGKWLALGPSLWRRLSSA
jgi:hypothetical protein